MDNAEKLRQQDLLAELLEPENKSEKDEEKSRFIGLSGPFGKQDAALRLLIVDDNVDVIENYQRALEDDAGLSSARFWFFAFKADGREGDLKALMKHLVHENCSYDAIFIDGDLNAHMDGIEVARAIRADHPYQPLAFLTAQQSWAEKHAAQRPLDAPLLFKFTERASSTLRRLADEAGRVKEDMRRRIWRDVQHALASRLASGMGADRAARIAGKCLVDHLGIKALYLREVREDGLRALTMHNGYDGVEELLPSEDVPDFMRELFAPDQEGHPYKIIDRLSDDEIGAITGMKDDRCIAVRLGAPGSAFLGSLTIYRDKSGSAFDERDATELLHVALQIQAALERARMLDRQQAQAEAIGGILTAADGAQTADILKTFVHDQFNRPHVPGGKVKTTLRMFRRGSADLVRIGMPPTLGNYEEKREGAKDPLNFSQLEGKSTYVKAIKENRPLLKPVRDPENDEEFVTTTVGDVRSFLLAPLSHDGAVIGGLKLEANHPNAYGKAERDVVTAMANLATVALFRRRAERFMHRVTELAALAVTPGETGASDIMGLLDGAARALYELYGFSNLIFAAPPPDANDNPDGPWQVAAAWRGDTGELLREEDARMKQWQEKLKNDWKGSYLKSCLENPANRRVFYTNDQEQIADTYDENDIRPGRPTLSQLVVRMGEGDGRPDYLFSLLFEHPHAVPKSHNSVLDNFARFMGAVLALRNPEEGTNLGERLILERMEKRAGRMASQLRHQVVNSLAAIGNGIQISLEEGKEPKDILDKVAGQLADAEKAAQALAKVMMIKVPKPQELDPALVWNQLIAEGHPLAQRQGMRIETATEGQMQVMADEDLLRNILFNLLDNALNHARNASRIRLCLNGNGEMAVCDDGDEIPADNRAKLFEPGFTTSSRGSGQGLYLSKGQVEEMQGELHYERKNGENCFVLTLPDVKGNDENG